MARSKSKQKRKKVQFKLARKRHTERKKLLNKTARSMKSK